LRNETIATLQVMSRKLTDDEVLGRADIVDCWTPSWAGPHPMMTLREALATALARAEPNVTLFRAGDASAPAIWLRADDIARLSGKLLAAAA
jgi:hypothetical protein